MRAAESGREVPLRRLATLVAVLVVGGLIGRATAPAAQTASQAPAPPPQDGTGTKTVAGVPVSFPETRSGAAAATAAYEEAFAEPAIMRPGVLEARVEAVATSDYAAQMLEANRPGVERLAAGPVGVGATHGLRTLYAGVPIGYRMTAYGRGRATVETWGLTLLGNAGAVEPSAWFGLSQTELAWVGGRWRIAGTESQFGPTPRLGTKPGPVGGYELLDLARSLRTYEPAP